MIDFHVHQPTAREASSGEKYPYGAAEYVAAMDELGIELSVVFTFDGLAHPSPAANDALAEWVAEAPDRLVAFGTVDPLSADAPRETERCLTDLGMRGLKFHPWIQGFCPHQPFMDPIAEVAADHGVPILFHDGTPPYSTPLQIAALARRHPRLPCVLGHGGLHDLWREAIVAVTRTPNLHVCLCATPNIGMREVARRCPPDRLLFGTDAGLAEPALQAFVAERVREVRSLAIPDELRRAMLFDNPRRLLRLEAA
jgi:predicted TIM-barrel fold metal-dependent hydrolase